MNELILVYVIISNIVEKYIILERIYKMKHIQFAIVPIIFFDLLAVLDILCAL